MAMYKLITEVLDFSPNVTKVILCVGKPLAGAVLTPEQFAVKVERIFNKPKDFVWPKFMGEKPEDALKGIRTVECAYVSDAEGNKKPDGDCITLEMVCAPMDSLGSTLLYDGSFNRLVGLKYAITLTAPIKTDAGVIEETVFDEDGGNRLIYGEWLQFGKFTHPDSDLGYAHYEPEHVENEKLPLVIWLHGAGEGGTDPIIAAIGNRVTNFLRPEMQAYFGGRAALLCPQTPTMWMNDGTGQYTKDGTSMYVEALDALIDAYIEEREWIDRDRVYIGGCSNGGFMTMKMLIHTPEKYAAAYPICEALADAHITDAQIKSIADKPIWFTHAKTDTTVPPELFAVPTYQRLIKAGGKNVHFTYWDKVEDLSGKYTKPNGEPHEYYGHWSWIYTLNNDCKLDFDGEPVQVNGNDVGIIEWLGAQKRTK